MHDKNGDRIDKSVSQFTRRVAVYSELEPIRSFLRFSGNVNQRIEFQTARSPGTTKGIRRRPDPIQSCLASTKLKTNPNLPQVNVVISANGTVTVFPLWL